MKKISREEAKEKINDFFKETKNKTTKENKKIKKLAMSHNIPLRELRKKFCKKCYTPYSGKEKVRIKNGIKTIECNNCKKINRWKIKLS
jgi:RNase P subunit RPR2